METRLVPKTKDNEIVVVNFPGWQRYLDICIMTRESTGRLILSRLIDYCSNNFQNSVAQFDKLSQLSEFNPHGLPDLADNIMGLGVDVYFTCFENELFELGYARDLPFELAHVGPHRLYLRRLIF